MAIRSPAAWRHATGTPRAVAERIHRSGNRHTRRQTRSSPTSTRTCRVGAAPTTARTSSSTRRNILTPAPTTRGSARGCLGGKTNIWGRLALRLSDYDFKAKQRDGYGEDWPISYKDIEPYYDKVDLYLGISGVKENLPHLPDSLFQRPTKLTAAEVTLRNSIGENGPRADAVPRGRHDRWPEAQQVSQPVLRARRVQPARRRLRHSRRLRLADGLDLPGDGHGQPDAADQCHRPRGPRRPEDRQGARRRVRRRRNGRELRGARNSRDPRGIDARVCAADAPLEIDDASERYRQFERARRTQLLRARDGPERDRPGEGPDRQTADAR